MAMNGGFRVLQVQLPQEFFQRSLLLWRARVLWCLAIGGHATDIADAYAVSVMAGAVCTDLSDGTASMDRPVAVYHIMIPDILEASGEMPLPDLSDGEIFSFRSGRAVDDEFCDFSHVSEE